MAEIDPRPRRPALGRGLAVLLKDGPSEVPRGGVLQIPIEQLLPDPHQPRQRFDPQRLDELAASVQAQGILQPILARRSEGKFVIVAGERRWRAAQRAGLHEVPVLLRDLTEASAFEVALVENLQRAELTPLEEAEAYRRLIEEHGLSQEQLAQRVGRERSTVANTLRLLRLPAEVKTALAEDRLSMGHARALLAVEDPVRLIALAHEVLRRGLSVRATEALVRDRRSARNPRSVAQSKEDPNQRQLRETLQRILGVKVNFHTLEKVPGRGSIEFHYTSLDELDRIVDKLLESR